MNSHYSDNINLSNSNFGSHVPIKRARKLFELAHTLCILSIL